MRLVHSLVEINYRGSRCAGYWTLTGRLITVTVPGYGRKIQLGATPPAILARIIGPR